MAIVVSRELLGAYNHLSAASQRRAQQFFRARERAHPHQAWMEIRFLQTLQMINQGTMASEVPANKIEAPNPSDGEYFEHFTALRERQEILENLGTESIKNGELMVFHLAGGMATGFGGIAKGAVAAYVDTRYGGKTETTYLDIKLARSLRLQRECGNHIVNVAMISEATKESIIENLDNFALKNNVKLVLIPDGATKDEIQAIWKANKSNWEDTMIVAIAMQPSTLLISKDGAEVGETYMKGHGDTADVVNFQLKDLIGITGAKYLFTSNVDNTGAVASREILGYFVEQSETRQIAGMMEAAAKFIGDKGGAPALINGSLSVLEGPFVPAEWQDAFAGKDTFPIFNTNTFWHNLTRAMGDHYSLPLMVSKELQQGGQTWLKVESIIAHWLDSMPWKALTIDRGQRFHPQKFLQDLWLARTDMMEWQDGKVMMAMRNGEYVRKPLVTVSNSVFGSVAELNSAIFDYGTHDAVTGLQSMVIGGEGKQFNAVGRYNTECGVTYEGDVAIIFKDGTGSLAVKGQSPNDRVTISDSLIYVRAGENRVVTTPETNAVDPRINRATLRETLENSGKILDPDQRERVLDKFTPA